MTSEELLKELPQALRNILGGKSGEIYSYWTDEAGSYRDGQEACEAIDLMIKAAEAMAANPRGFQTWFKVTSGVEL